MANPEALRKADKKLPRNKRRYPASRVTQALYALIGVVVLAWLITLI